MNCDVIQDSLQWCEGKPSYPGIKRRIYYIAKQDIATWPTRSVDSLGRIGAGDYTGNFTLVTGKKWLYIDILPDKSQVTSESQGEYPGVTQLNRLTAVHAGVDAAANMMAGYVNNIPCVFLVEQFDGTYRVIGCKEFDGTATVAQDLGQGATGSTSTTLTAQSTDFTPAPVYSGTVQTTATVAQNQ